MLLVCKLTRVVRNAACSFAGRIWCPCRWTRWRRRDAVRSQHSTADIWTTALSALRSVCIALIATSLFIHMTWLFWVQSRTSIHQQFTSICNSILCLLWLAESGDLRLRVENLLLMYGAGHLLLKELNLLVSWKIACVADIFVQMWQLFGSMWNPMQFFELLHRCFSTTMQQCRYFTFICSARSIRTLPWRCARTAATVS